MARRWTKELALTGTVLGGAYLVSVMINPARGKGDTNEWSKRIGMAVMIFLVGVEFIANPTRAGFRSTSRHRAGSSLDYTTIKIGQVENALREFPEVASIYSTVNTGGNSGKHKASMLVSLVPQQERERTPIALADSIRQRLSAIPWVDIAIIQEGLGGGQVPYSSVCWVTIGPNWQKLPQS